LGGKAREAAIGPCARVSPIAKSTLLWGGTPPNVTIGQIGAAFRASLQVCAPSTWKTGDASCLPLPLRHQQKRNARLHVSPPRRHDQNTTHHVSLCHAGFPVTPRSPAHDKTVKTDPQANTGLILRHRSGQSLGNSSRRLGDEHNRSRSRSGRGGGENKETRMASGPRTDLPWTRCPPSHRFVNRRPGAPVRTRTAVSGKEALKRGFSQMGVELANQPLQGRRPTVMVGVSPRLRIGVIQPTPLVVQIW